MSTFAISLPNGEQLPDSGDLQVEANHWIEAWSRAVELLGHGPADPGRMDCTFEDDGSIEITDRESGRRMLLKCVNVFRGREITLESLTDLCAVPARRANSFAITRNLAKANDEPATEEGDDLPLPTQLLRPALSWFSHDLEKIKTPDQAILTVMESFPCELAVHLVPTAQREWQVSVSAGAQSKRITGSLLCRSTPIPPWKGALVGRRAFSDETRGIHFRRRILPNTRVVVRSVIWTAIPSPRGGVASRLMLINGESPRGFGDQDLSGLVSLVQALGPKWDHQT